MSTGLVYHPDFVLHTPYPGNPEVPERVSGTVEYFRSSGLLDRVDVVEPVPATEEDVLLAHEEGHYEYVKNLSETGYSEDDIINTDVYVSPNTCGGALLAAGGVKAAFESVISDRVGNCFALVRPPGHHAGPLRPSGFCYFNSTAIAIRDAQRRLGVGRVAVFDWDAHCGNGTMEVFYSDPTVLTVSVHQDPTHFFPGTGFAEQTGKGEGKGYCMNFPIQPGAGDADYLKIIDEFVLEEISSFDPDLLVVAAGQDGHVSDHISALELTDAGYARMASKMVALAEEVCGGRAVLVLEGGYNLETLPKTHERIVKALLGENGTSEVEGDPLPSTLEVIETARKHAEKEI